ncbi:hypothetical protein ASD70_19035 [Pseudomonas sp. Root569]|nr:hypothetical protein ASD70_19035 [Pseudomonas sp. Root569]
MFTQRGAGNPTGDPADQTTQNRSSKTANSDPDRPTDHTDYRTGFRRRQGSGGSTGCTAGDPN